MSDRGTVPTAARIAALLAPAVVLAALALVPPISGRPYLVSSAIALALVWLIGAARATWPIVRWLDPFLGALAVSVATGLAWRTQLPYTDWLSIPARGAAAAALAAAVVLAAGRDPRTVLDQAVHAVGVGLRSVVGAVLFVVVVVPAWAWTSVRRRNPVRPGRDAAPEWATVPDARPAAATRLGGSPPAGLNRRSLVGRLSWAVGCVALLVGINYGVGWAWDRSFPTDEATLVEPTDPGFPTINLGPIHHDPRADLPSMAAYPWRERYFTDMQRMSGGYWPFTEYRPYDYTSPYINQRDWVRQSYTAKGKASSMPVVWMFGGSTTWGEGQRDDFTIGSWLVRLSERDGIPIRMRNYGERGWTHFQEMVLYEQLLESQPKPDFSMFYDGANEITTQSLLDEAVPSHTLAFAYAKKLFGTTVATEVVQKPRPRDLRGDILDAYREHSAIHKLVDLVRGTPAGASPLQAEPTAEPEPAPGEGFTGGQTQGSNGVYDYQYDDQDGVDAGKVYERGKRFTMMLSKRHKVRSFLFWQPVQFNGSPQQKARAQLTAPTIDIADTLERHQDVFIDGGHTNEEGARLVAVEIWKHVKPSVVAWYEANR